MRQPPESKGLSLIEVMLAIVIFATAIPSIGYIFGTAFKQESENSQHTQATALAESLMNEISSHAFYESSTATGNCLDTGEENGFDRRGFDDMDDYAIFSKDCGTVSRWGELTPPRSEAGAALADYAGFSQYVEVYNVKAPLAGPASRADYDAESDGATDFKLVVVTISWNASKNKVKLYKVFTRPT